MKKLLSIVLSLAMVFSMCAFAAPSTEMPTDTAAEYTETAGEAELASEDEATLSAVSYAPGLNALTGTTSPADFETSTDTYFGVAPGTASIVDNNIAKEGNTSAKIFDFAVGSATYCAIAMDYNFENGRKYRFSWDDYHESYQGSTRYTGYKGWFLSFYGTSHQSLNSDAMKAAYDNNKWCHQDYTLSTTANKTELRLQMKVWDDGGAATGHIYLDNFAIYPFYKINYVNALGNVGETDQVLTDAEGNIITSYTVKSDNYPIWDKDDGTVRNCVGWALTEGATAEDVVTSVNLENADVTLYPVWEVVPYLEGAEFMKAATGTKTTITASEETTWQVEVGNTGATVETTGTTAVITAANRPGTVTLTATKVSDPTFSVAKKVNLCGAYDWTPGLNVLTNSTQPYTFESISMEEAK